MKPIEERVKEHLSKHIECIQSTVVKFYILERFGGFYSGSREIRIEDSYLDQLEQNTVSDGRYGFKYLFSFLTNDMKEALKKNSDSGEEHKPTEKQIIDREDYASCEIEVTAEEFPDIKGGPLWITVDKIDGVEQKLVMPILANSLSQYLAVVDNKLSDHRLSADGSRTIKEFYTFKYQTCLRSDSIPEGKRTYYNILLYGDLYETVDSYADLLIGCLGYDPCRMIRISEARLFERYDRGDLNGFLDSKDAVYISDCKERPYINEDAGTGKGRDESLKQAERYVNVWRFIADLIKKNPSVTFIIGMDKYVYRNSFAIDNEVANEALVHSVYVPEMETEQILDLCLKEFTGSSFEITPDFKIALEDYVRAVYDDSELKGRKFVSDLVHRVFYTYFIKPQKKKVLDSHYVPTYTDKHMSIDKIFDRLNGLVGLKSVKETLKSIYKNAIANPENAPKEAYHMMFYGNPGTGKTTVAKLVADLLFNAGIIKTNKCTEATVTDLVSVYKSSTGAKTKALVQKAMNGVLFIDEAYGLVNGDNDRNSEALNILIQEMLKNQDDLVVILAGYENEMEELLKSNAGLSSRIAYKVRFDDFSVDELKQIFKQRCRDVGFSLAPEAEGVLEECIEGRKLQDFFGNARDMKNLVTSLQSNWAEEYYSLITGTGEKDSKPERVFHERHFEGLMPEKNTVGIDNLVGLETVKKEINKFKTQVKYLHAIKEYGMKKLPESFMHMVFMGNPGTGKTTVAKMLANDLYSMGVLKTNRLVVIERKDLVSPLRGETSRKTEEFIHKAIGGVLFIDEAYSLVDAEETGKEVIEALITAMVDHKEDTIFIFAGYYNEMRKFLEINPGIPSRIGYTFVFEDYKTDELLRIFHDQMDEAGFTISEGVDAKVKGIFEYFREMPQFGNGRFVEQLISRIISKRAERDYNNTDYSRIDECDIPEISDLIDTNSSGLRLHDPQKITDESRLRTAYHELGHAIAIYEFKPALDMEKISICDGAMSLGRVSFKRLGRNRTEEELQNEIAINLAGRCAERVFFGNCDEGCVSDYESAVEISKNMIEKYGMCDIGLTKPEDLLREADRQATKVIQKYQTCIEKIAEELIKGKEFSGEEFAEYVKKYSD